MIELLAVIAVLAILMALLIPAVMSIREKGQAAQGVSNLRQIGVAMGLFFGDGNQKYPYHYGPTDSGVYKPWMDVLEPYLPDPDGEEGPANEDRKNNAVFYCPAEETHNNWSDYGANMQFFANGQVLEPSRMGLYDVADPSKAVTVATVRHLGLSPVRGYWAFNGRDYVNNPEANMRPYPRLAESIGLLYADGHVDTLSDDELREKARDILLRDQ